MKSHTHKPAITVGNLFKRLPDRVLRRIISEPKKEWCGQHLAREMGISTPWVDRIFATLEFEGFAERISPKPHGRLVLKNVDKLLTRWSLSYNIGFNKAYNYHFSGKDPIKAIKQAALKEGFRYALTGQAARSLIAGKGAGPIVPQIYVYSEERGIGLNEIFQLLEEKYGFLAVLRHPNVVLLEPWVKENVFYDCRKTNGYTIVSELQLRLDQEPTETN